MGTSNRLGRGFPVPPVWIGPGRHDSWWKIGAFVENSPPRARLASGDGICTYANSALQR